MIVDTVSSKASLIYSAFKALDVSSHGEHFELVQLVCQPCCVCSLDSWVQTSVGFVFFKNRAPAKRKLTNSSNSMYFFLGLNHLNPKIWLLTLLLNCYIFPCKLIAWMWFLPLRICFSPHYRRRNFRVIHYRHCMTLWREQRCLYSYRQRPIDQSDWDITAKCGKNIYIFFEVSPKLFPSWARRVRGRRAISM